MQHPDIHIVEATADDCETVSTLVTKLLHELEHGNAEKTHYQSLDKTARDLLARSKIWAFIAKRHDTPVGVITLHECAAIYAQGIFGEISELYVVPEYRSANIGGLLLAAAIEKGHALGWKRLEVGTPPPNDSPRTIAFYESQGFQNSGLRMRYGLSTQSSYEPAAKMSE